MYPNIHFDLLSLLQSQRASPGVREMHMYSSIAALLIAHFSNQTNYASPRRCCSCVSTSSPTLTPHLRHVNLPPPWPPAHCPLPLLSPILAAAIEVLTATVATTALAAFPGDLGACKPQCGSFEAMYDDCAAQDNSAATQEKCLSHCAVSLPRLPLRPRPPPPLSPSSSFSLSLAPPAALSPLSCASRLLAFIAWVWC